MSDISYRIAIELKYEKRGVLPSSTCQCKEFSTLRLNDMQAVKDYYRDDFIKAIKKAVNLMNSDNVFRTEITLFTEKDYVTNNTICLTYRGASDKFNDTYTIYRYYDFDLNRYYASADCHDNGQAVVSKKALLNELIGYVDKLIKKYEVENEV